MSFEFWSSRRTFRELRADVGQTFASLRYICGLLEEVAPGHVRAGALLTVFAGLAVVLHPFVVTRFVEAVVTQGQRNLSPVLVWIGVEAALTMSSAALGARIAARTEPLESTGHVALTTAVLSKACRVHYSNFESQQFVDRLERAKGTTGDGLWLVLEVFAIVRSSVVFVGSLVLLVMAWIWAVPLVALLAVPAHLLRVSHARRSFAIDEASVGWSRQRWYLEWLITTEATAKELRAFQAEDWLTSLYRRVRAPPLAAQLALSHEYRTSQLACEGLAIAARYGAYAYVLKQAINGELSLAANLLFMMTFPVCVNSLNQLLASLAGMLAKGFRARAMIDFLKLDEEESADGSEVLLECAPELIFEDIWFSYPGRNEVVLRGLHLRVRAGETLAIVGVNGAGKTTLLKLLLGLYPIQRGRILLGGVDVSTRSIAWRRKNIGAMFQDFGRFPFSALDNVGIGWASDRQDETKVWSSLEQADADNLVRGLNDGLKTPLGRAFGGSDLSGGQWQRIAMARLFMRKSMLWVLDEPTAAIDPESEERTFRRFAQRAVARTVLIISHRLSTVARADRVAVLHDGQVVEIGTHQDLLSAGGRYARFFSGRAQPTSNGSVDSAAV
jgi:ATP-binding cassette, subfamily B, bacterial